MIRKKVVVPIMHWILPQEKFAGKFRGVANALPIPPLHFHFTQRRTRINLYNWWLGFTSLQPRTGEKLWELSVFGRPHSERAISSPIVTENLVLGVCGFTTLDKHLVAIRPASASQDGKAREVWRMEETMPHIPTPLISGDRLYLWADNGVITCLRPSSGEKVWKARVENVKDTFFGSPVLAGNTVFVSPHTARLLLFLIMMNLNN